jgi:enediyne biosynthesis protein E4
MAALCRLEEIAAIGRRNGHRPHPLMISCPIYLRLLVFAGVILSAASSVAQKTAATAAHPGIVKSATQFADVTRSSGIDFHLTCGGLEKLYIMESMCGGVAVLDYDNDGWMDIFLVNGSTIENMRDAKCHPSKLYRNNHDGTFIDVSSKAGLAPCVWGFGVAVGDYDNDGWEDVYVTSLQGGTLYHNEHNGTFTEVTVKAGVGDGGQWGTSAAFGDYDNDGFLDLYVVNYVDLDLNHLPAFGSTPFCQYRGFAVSCGPRGLKGSRDRLYHNNKDGTFTDVTEKLGIDRESYYGLGVIWLDYDKDGCLDLYVADDSSPSLLYHNDCKGGFTEVGTEAGVAYSADGREQAGMGVDSADYDNDGWPDIAKTNFSDDLNNLYHNDHSGDFTDVAGPTGFGAVSSPFLGFGVKFLDYDNDGWQDVFVANGHVNPQVDQHSFGVTYAERPLFFHNLKNGKYQEVGLHSGPALSWHYVARGAAAADFLNNGQLDILFTTLDGSPVLLRNERRSSGHWLRIKAQGAKSNRDGFGAQVEIRAGGQTQYAEIRANGSFESASDPRLHVGLGPASKVEAIRIRWPSGKVDNIDGEAADQELVIAEAAGVIARNRPKQKY